MKKLLFGLLILALLVSACGGVATSTPQQTVEAAPALTSAAPPTADTAPGATEGSAAADRARTLASLRRIDDWPLYEMHYYGDYGFDGFLEQGIQAGYRPQSYAVGVAEKWACTCVATLNEERDLIFGRNFDWYVHPALILFTNPPTAYASVSMVDISYLGYDQEHPAEDEREGLLDVPYFPFDGMNEYGLAVGIMAVPHAEGGDDPDKVTIGSLHVVRLLLDYAKDVDEAVSLLDNYNVDFGGGPPVHYLIADPAGHSVVAEFIDGQVHATWNKEPWQVATNFLVSDAASDEGRSHCWRYSTAYQTLEMANGKVSQEEAMSLLEEVSQSGDLPTIWSTVYNMTGGDINIVVGREYDHVHRFNLLMRHE